LTEEVPRKSRSLIFSLSLSLSFRIGTKRKPINPIISRAWEYRQRPNILSLHRPSRTDKAHRLGYKAKQGYVIVRAGVRRGGRHRQVHRGMVFGKPKHQGVSQLKWERNLQSLAEEKVGRKYTNLRVLNSYWVNQDAVYKYYEVICVDPSHTKIRNDPRANWICDPVHKHRELRGLTSAGRKSRGLRQSGHRANGIIGGSSKAAWLNQNSMRLKRKR
jgi:large subunit ribosomal protein L15e